MESMLSPRLGPEILIIFSALILLIGNRLHLMYRIRRNPVTTAVGVTNHVRRNWVESVMREKRDIMAVQTLRNP